MLKMLYTDMRNILHNKGVKVCGFACLAYLIGNLLISIILLKVFDATLLMTTNEKGQPQFALQFENKGKGKTE